MTREKNIGESPLNSTPGKRINFKLKKYAVGNEHLKDGCITSDKVAESFKQELEKELFEDTVDVIGRRIVSNKFGNSLSQGVSQKLITDTFNDLYSQLREMRGEPPIGLYLTAIPEFYIGEEGCNIHIKAISTSGVMEHVAFYINDTPISGAEAESVYQFESDAHIEDTSVLKCVATILGVDYSVEKTLTHYTSFWLGAGNTYEDIMDAEHTIPLENTIRGAFDIDCNDGEHFIIIVGDTLKPGFIRADLNGFEIPFDTEKITKDGNDYWVFTSKNTYRRGIYNIDING